MKVLNTYDALTVSQWNTVLNSSYLQDFCREIEEEICDEDDRTQVLKKIQSINIENISKKFVEDLMEIINENEYENDDDEPFWGYIDNEYYQELGTVIMIRIQSQMTLGVVIKDDRIMGEFTFTDEDLPKHVETVFSREPKYRKAYPDMVRDFFIAFNIK
jgi:hypothetical protein